MDTAAGRLAEALVDAGRAHAEWLQSGLEAQRLRLARLWIAAACTLFFALVASVWLAAWLVLLCEPAWRATAAGLATAAFALAAAVGAWRWRAVDRDREPTLHQQLLQAEAGLQRARLEAAFGAWERGAPALPRAGTLLRALRLAWLAAAAWRRLHARRTPPT